MKEIAYSMSVEDARRNRVCRICGDPCGRNTAGPKDWQLMFAKMAYPESITLNYGKEYAHTDCLLLEGPGKGGNDAGS
jgi:hypothetical protein